VDRSDHERRERAWREFHAWERSQPPPGPTFAEALVWLDSCLRIARRRGDLVEEPIEEKAARLARIREALAALRR
jgi:hypothetical protein